MMGTAQNARARTLKRAQQHIYYYTHNDDECASRRTENIVLWYKFYKYRKTKKIIKAHTLISMKNAQTFSHTRVVGITDRNAGVWVCGPGPCAQRASEP